MDTIYDLANALMIKAGKKLSDMSDESFTNLMKDLTKEDLDKIREYLVRDRDFYKRVLLEEYRKKHPNSFRYKDADERIVKINNKGKLLKTIIDSK